jgi:hypothetical protein
VEWWSSAQPKWRKAKWPFVQEDSTGRDWGKFVGCGKDGIFLIVVSLAWWVYASEGPSQGSKLDDAITDVAWVLGNLVSLLSADAIAPDPVACASIQSAPPPRKRRAQPTKTRELSKRTRT